MRNVTIIVLAISVLAVSVNAAEPDGWNPWLYIGEAAAGFALGIGTIYGLFQTTPNEAVFFLGYGGGVAGGVLLVGELFGARSENWQITYPATFAVSAVLPAAITYTTFALTHEEGEPFSNYIGSDPAVAVALYSVIIGTPNAAAITYNLVKDPVKPKNTEPDIGFNIAPHTTVLTDSGGGIVPLYGVTVSF